MTGHIRCFSSPHGGVFFPGLGCASVVPRRGAASKAASKGESKLWCREIYEEVMMFIENETHMKPNEMNVEVEDCCILLLWFRDAPSKQDVGVGPQWGSLA